MSLCVISCLTLPAFKILFVFRNFGYNVSWCYISGLGTFELCKPGHSILPNICEDFVYYFLNKLLSPLSFFLIPWVSNCVSIHMMVPYKFHEFSSLSFIFFFFLLSLNNFKWLIFELTDIFFPLLESDVEAFSYIFMSLIALFSFFCLVLFNHLYLFNF